MLPPLQSVTVAQANGSTILERLRTMQWEALASNPLIRALLVLLVGLVLGFMIGKFMKRLLVTAGVPELVEGTPFERSARSLGTSTVDVIARLTSWFIYGTAVLVAINAAEFLPADRFWDRVFYFLPHLFVALFVVVAGFVVADKAELLVSERTKGIKLPEVALLPKLVKYSVLYVAFLIALSQVGVATIALTVLLGLYFFGLIFLGGIAFWDFLRSGAAGIYLLLNQPYGIGDEIRVDGHEGIVQGMDVFVTRVEADGEEYVVPNHQVFRGGVVRVRD